MAHRPYGAFNLKVPYASRQHAEHAMLVPALLVLALAGLTAAQQGSTGAGTAIVSASSDPQPVILQALINSETSSLDFTVPFFTIVPMGWRYITAATPLYLTRNFTLSSSASPPTVVNFEYLSDRIVLNPGTIFSFENVTLQNIRCACLSTYPCPPRAASFG